MSVKISQELKDTVAKNKHIKKVHFTAKGDHYFHVHEYKSKDEEDEDHGKKYGRLSLEAVHVGNEGDRKIFKSQSVPVAEAEIVKTLTRDEILKAKTEEEAAAEQEASAQQEVEKLKKELADAKAAAAKAEKEAAEAKAAAAKKQ